MSGAFPEDTSVLDAGAGAHVEGLARDPVRSRNSRPGSPTQPIWSCAASGRYVLRRKPPGKLLNMAHMIEREFRGAEGSSKEHGLSGSARSGAV